MNCILCGATEWRVRCVAEGDRLYRTTDRRFAIVACARCGLMRLEPQPASAELARYYPADYWFAPDRSVASRLEETYRRLVLRDHLSFVERALADVRGKGPVLDVGCGGGLLLGMLRERGYRVAGLDSSPEAASIAWKRQNVAAVCGSLANSPLRAGSCAAVLMFHVLEHLSDPRAYLEAAHALLPAGGKLIVQVPNAASLQHRWLGPRWNGLDVPRHLYDFRAQDVVNLVENCGFRVVRRKHFSLRDNPAGLASSLAPELDPMARRVRAVPEGPAAKLVKDLLYFALTALSVPFAAAEAACGAGSSIMLEAVVRSSMPVSLAPEGHNS